MGREKGRERGKKGGQIGKEGKKKGKKEGGTYRHTASQAEEIRKTSGLTVSYTFRLLDFNNSKWSTDLQTFLLGGRAFHHITFIPHSSKQTS